MCVVSITVPFKSPPFDRYRECPTLSGPHAVSALDLITNDVVCSFSGKEMYAQNLKEHQMKACPRRFG